MPKGSWVEFNDSGKIPEQKTIFEEIPKSDRQVRVMRTSGGKSGKTVTVISGLQLDEVSLKKLLKSLKKNCSTGGTAKDNCLELQGDQIAVVMKLLSKEGFSPKKSGG